MRKLIPNEIFHQNNTKSFVELLNAEGIKANVLEDGFEYDFESFVQYAKSTPKGRMPIWFTEWDNANLRWLLGDKYKEIYK